MLLKKLMTLLITGLAATLLSTTSAQALTITVNDLGDVEADDGVCTLREAIVAINDQAESGASAGECGQGAVFDATDDTIDLTSLTGTITLTSGGLPQMIDPMTINGPGADTLTIDGDGTTDRIFFMDDASASPVSFGINNLTVTGGAGILVSDDTSTLTLESVTVTINTTATDAGGGIRNDGVGGIGGSAAGTIIINNCNIIGNSTTGHGGGITNQDGGIMTITNSTISGNISASRGGAIRNNDDDSVITISNSTISDNTSALDGGAISNDDDDGNTITLLNVTITNNRTTGGDGGGISNENGGADTDSNTIIIGNSIIAGNFDDDDGAAPDCNDPSDDGVMSNGNNLIGDIVGCTNHNFDADPMTLNDQFGDSSGAGDLDAMLANLSIGPLAVHALLDGSPAIGGVDNNILLPPVMDQLGNTRSQSLADTTDIGAVQATCGDGQVQSNDLGEECDNGENNDDTVADACRTDCTNASCGDGVVDTDEECDSTDGCRDDCTNEPGTTDGVGDGSADGTDDGSADGTDDAGSGTTGSTSSSGCNLITATAQHSAGAFFAIWSVTAAFLGSRRRK